MTRAIPARAPDRLQAIALPRGMAPDQQTRQKPRVIRRRPRPAIAPAHRPKVEAIHHLDHEPRQMPLGQPLIYRGRQQETGLTVNRAETARTLT